MAEINSSFNAAQVLDGFAGSLTSPPAQPPEGVINPFGGSVTRRYNVYRNNVAVSLKGALADIYPVTRELVGARFFDGMALEYMMSEPPQSPILAEYGNSFPAFISAFKPAEKLFFLKDVATLERTWLNAFHAMDCAPLSPQDLTSHTPETLMLLTFKAHPAATVLRFESAAVTIFQRVKNGESLKNFDPSGREDALVVRPDYDISVHNLEAGHADFLVALRYGKSITEAAEIALDAEPSFDLASAFAVLMTSGAFQDMNKGDAS